MVKKIVLLIMVFLCITGIFAESVSDDGSHAVEFVISDLVRQGFCERVKVKNFSNNELTNIQLRIFIDGKDHRLEPISILKPGKTGSFDGVEDDDMDEELKHFFGAAGKLNKKNMNGITFVLTFGSCNKGVVITEYNIKDDDLFFVVEDKVD